MIFEVKLTEIPNEDSIFRNIHCASYKKWSPKRRPNEADFRFDKDGMSVTWEKYCTLTELFIIIGLQKNKSGQYRNPKEFKVIKFNVKQLRNLILSTGETLKVIYSPTEENIGHSLVCCPNEELLDEVRLKLCDMVETFEEPLIQPDIEVVNNLLLNKREQVAE